MLEQIMDRRNVERAMLQVERNKGVGGVDGMRSDELRAYLNAHYQTLRQEVTSSTYTPSAVRKVEIPKPQGGLRMLGIPTVIDRMVQQAISQWLEQLYEPEFSAYSFGFRPGRNAHQAVIAAQSYLNEGRDYVVELDLEKFFDVVNHDKLMSLLMRKVKDKGTLDLIRKYLRSGIMEGGVVSQRIEGTPQGSPLSPLLSNIMLDELDKELTARGHKFVRYADDCSIYVGSEKSAQRVLETVTTYIEKSLKLRVNREKSKVSRPSESTLLGFSFYRDKESWQIRVAPKTIRRIKEKCKELTRRNNGKNNEQKITSLRAVVEGWVNYFHIARAATLMRTLDGMVRVRLRMGLWKEWKTCKTRVRQLLKLGARKWDAYMWGNASKSYCRIAHSPILQGMLPNSYFARAGYVGFAETFNRKNQHTQLSLF
jgi:group II intron reverse transcriptase/maturase